MDEKLTRTISSPDFPNWRLALWTEISQQALAEGYVHPHEVGPDGLIDPISERWHSLYTRLVEIRYLFRLPVSRAVHARFLHPAKEVRRVDVGYLSFHTSPIPGRVEKGIFERRKGEFGFFCLWSFSTLTVFQAELMEWRNNGGTPPILTLKTMRPKSPKAR